MLKGSKSPLDRHWPAARLLAVGAVVLCGLLAAGLGTPALAAEAEADAAEAAEPNPAPKAAQADLKAEFYADFRGGNFDRERLVPVGVDTLYAWGLLKPGPNGLRITVPDHQGEKKPYLGVTPLVKVVGDFEITASYQILALDRPQANFYPGANLNLRTQYAKEQTRLRRCITPDGVDAYRVQIEVGTKQAEWQAFPAQGKSGKLRLARTGAILEYSVAEGDSDDFRRLARGEFGTRLISDVRLDASTDRSRSTVDVLWKDVKIRAEEIEPAAVPLLRTGPHEPAGTP